MEGSSSSSSSSPYNPSSPYDPASATEAGKNANEALLKQSGELGEPETQATSYIGSNWLSLPLLSESESPIQPRQGAKAPSTVKSPWKVQQRDPEEYENDQVGKYAEYFKGNEILPIPEILQKLESRILSLVVTDLKTRRLVGLKKEGFEDLFRKVLRRGTSCSPRKSKQLGSHPIISQPSPSDCSQNT